MITSYVLVPPGTMSGPTEIAKLYKDFLDRGRTPLNTTGDLLSHNLVYRDVGPGDVFVGPHSEDKSALAVWVPPPVDVETLTAAVVWIQMKYPHVVELRFSRCPIGSDTESVIRTVAKKFGWNTVQSKRSRPQR